VYWCDAHKQAARAWANATRCTMEKALDSRESRAFIWWPGTESNRRHKDFQDNAQFQGSCTQA
jgi:hypothetical protein